MSEFAVEATENSPAREPLSMRARAGAGLAIVFSSVATLYFFYSRHLSNLYGDGISHVEGARRIFDSVTPGYAEIGSTWLPLLHILASPLAQDDFLWKTGLAGSLISILAFAITAWVLFHLSWDMTESAFAAMLSLALFILCPSMDYLASTPLTEPLALMWAVLVVYGLARFQGSGKNRPLLAAGLAAFFGALTRYDGWYLLPFAALFVLLARSDPWRVRFRHAFYFSLLSGAGPVLWFLHNAFRFGNALEFYNGPYSAKAIYAHQLATTAFRYPTDGSFLISARYYLADLTLVIGVWPLELAALGLVVWALESRAWGRRAAALLFLVPFVFYVQSMAGAAIPIYVPTLFPYTYYNLRYGIEMLPAVAVFPAFLISPRLERRIRVVLLIALLATVLGQGAALLAGGVNNLGVVAEAEANTPCRSKDQQALIRFFRTHYDGQTVLVAVGQWPCVMPEVGIPFHRTLSETNAKMWKQLPQGADPWAEWIIRGEGDAVDDLMRAYPRAFRNFGIMESDKFPGEAPVRIYRRRRP